MRNVYQLPQPEQRYHEASQWIARLDKQLSGEEAAALQTWMAADPENEAVLLQMASLWDKMDALGRLSSLFPPVESRGHFSAERRSRFSAECQGRFSAERRGRFSAEYQSPFRFPLLTAASVAAAVLVAVGVWFAVLQQPRTPPTEYVYQTDLGEHSTVTLQDGTQLVLNTRSRVSVNYTDKHRLLTLERGEIYVNVAKDASRPLSVVAGDKIVQAVGTEFSIQITNDQQIELVVVEGKVKVGVHQRPSNVKQVAEPAVLAPSAKTVTAGKALVLGSPEEVVTDVSPGDIEVKLSWRQGNLIFRGESLEDAVREVERYTAVEFVFLDEDLKKIRVAGLFKAGDVNGLLATLRENFDIVYQYTDTQKVELSR